MERDALCVTRRALDLKDLGALAVFVDLDSYLTEELNHAGWKAQLKSRDHSASLIEMQALLGIEGQDEAQSALQPHLCCRLWFFRLGLETAQFSLPTTAFGELPALCSAATVEHMIQP